MRFSHFTIPIVLLILSLVAPARAQRQDRDPVAASISGRVTIEGRPAPGVAVTATRVEGVGEAQNFGDTTDADGRFNITGVTPGAYAITPRAYAFVLSNRDQNTPNGRRIVVGAGETIEGVALELVRGCVVTGRVIDEVGNPVVGGYVSLGKPRSGGTAYIEYINSPLPGMGETDDRGVYRIFGVPAGPYVARAFVTAERRRDSLNYPVFYPNARDELKAKLIELSAGEERTDIDITVVPPEKTYAVSGHLIDAASGKPVPYVYIGHQPLDGNTRTDIFPNSIDEGITDEEGSFRIAGLFPGRYGIFISTISDRDTEWYSDDLAVDVASEDLTGLELKAHAGASVSGVVAIEGANDQRKITTPAGLMVLTYSPDNSEALSGKSVGYRVGSNGKFRLPGLRAGAVRLSVMSAGNPETSLSIDRVEVAGQPVRDTLDLKEGQSISDARIVMVYGAGVVRGQVKFQNGEPPANACFSVHTGRKGDCLNCFRNFQARVSAGGQYTLEGLPPGEYELTLYA